MTTSSAPRVLVVDDEEHIRFILSSALRNAGFDTALAGTGREALEAAESFRPDAVVLNALLPDIDGFTVLQRLRDRGSRSPVIFLIAPDITDDLERGLTAGAVDYQVKPVAVPELVTRVRFRLQQAGLAPTRSLRCADLRLDPDAYRVTRNGQVVDLTPTEYKLLHLLLANAGRVLTRAQILDRVWSYDFDGDSSIVDTYISYLRRKVDRVEPKLIHTVRGVGFMLRANQ